MTEFTGFTIVSGAEYADNNPHLSQELDTLGLWDWPPVPALAGTTVDCSTCPETNNLLVSLEHPQSFAGNTAPAFSQDWYDTIHLLPNPIVLGNLLSSQERDIEVWNAYFTSQNLAAITPANADGLTLQEPQVPPTDFGPLESRTYTLNTTTAGPSTIDATYTFDFPSDDPVLRVTGRRVIAFPFQPNWQSPVIERLEWKNQVLEHWDGSEQVVKVRQVPRKVYEFKLTTFELDRQRLNASLWGWQAQVFAVPVWTDITQLTATASTDDTTLYLPTTNLDFQNEGLLFLFDNTGNYEVVEIATVGASDVTLNLGVLKNWPKYTLVAPAKLARLDKSVTNGLLNPDIYDGGVKFTLEANTDGTATESLNTYRGLPILEIPPYWHKPINSEFTRNLQILDNSSGIRTFDDSPDHAFFIQDYHWAETGRDAIQTLREWFNQRQGKRVAFWTSTWQLDMTLYEDIQDVDTFLKIYNIGYGAFYNSSISRRDIKIHLKDGTTFYRRISASVDNGEYETLTIDSSLGQLVKTTDIRMISFVYLARLDSDQIEIVWRNPQFVEVSSLIRGLKYDV